MPGRVPSEFLLELRRLLARGGLEIVTASLRIPSGSISGGTDFVVRLWTRATNVCVLLFCDDLFYRLISRLPQHNRFTQLLRYENVVEHIFCNFKCVPLKI